MHRKHRMSMIIERRKASSKLYFGFFRLASELDDVWAGMTPIRRQAVVEQTFQSIRASSSDQSAFHLKLTCSSCQSVPPSRLLDGGKTEIVSSLPAVVFGSCPSMLMPYRLASCSNTFSSVNYMLFFAPLRASAAIDCRVHSSSYCSLNKAQLKWNRMAYKVR